MNIKKYYEATLNKNKYIYKINKVLINLFYPFTKVREKGVDDCSDVIVSLTTYPARIHVVYLTITSLLRQTKKPKKVILWLANEDFPNKEEGLPSKLLNLKKYGLKIDFCDNLYPHKKYFYTMQKYSEYKIITVDDDVLYPENLVEELNNTSLKYPDTICCTWCHKIHLDDNNDVYTCNTWDICYDGNTPSFLIEPVGIGGVLYPPKSLSEDVFDKEQILSYCLKSDDLWLKSMALLNGTKAVRVERPAKIFFTIIKVQKTGLYYDNVDNNKNLYAWDKIMENYPEVRRRIIDAAKEN